MLSCIRCVWQDIINSCVQKVVNSWHKVGHGSLGLWWPGFFLMLVQSTVKLSLPSIEMMLFRLLRPRGEKEESEVLA